jgi:hypothetical protein
MPQPFHVRFKINIGLEEAQRRFVNRAHNLIFEQFFLFRDHFSEDDLFHIKRFVLTHLGERANYTVADRSVTDLIGDNYDVVLKAIEAFYETLGNPEHKAELEAFIRGIIKGSEVDLGITWKDGCFWPTGAKVLDDKLVNDPLDWLRQADLKTVVQPFEKALTHLLRARQKPEFCSDAMTDAYEATEAMAKIVTGRDGDLSKNRELFIEKVRASQEYKQILRDYIDYGCRFRHAAAIDRPKPTASYHETESFIYLSGLFIRLALGARHKG